MKSLLAASLLIVAMLTGGCDFGGCFGSYGLSPMGPPQYYVSVVEVPAAVSYTGSGTRIAQFNDGASSIGINAPDLSVRNDGLQIIRRDPIGSVRYRGDGFNAIADSLKACRFATPPLGLICAVERPDTLQLSGGPGRVGRARSAVYLFDQEGRQAVRLLSAAATPLVGDRYSITAFGSPSYSADGRWLAVWAWRTTREVIRNVSGAVTGEFRYAADRPHAILIDQESNARIDVPLPDRYGPYEQPPFLSIASGGRFLALEHAGEVLLLEVPSGRPVLTLAARLPRFSPDGTRLAVISTTGLSELKQVNLTGTPMVTGATLPGPLVGHAFAGPDAALFGATADGVFRIAESGRPVQPVVTYDALSKALVSDPDQFYPRGAIVDLSTLAPTGNLLLVTRHTPEYSKTADCN